MIELLASELRESFSGELSCVLERLTLTTGIECAPFDFEALGRADAVFAFPGNSAGVHLQLGWASALEIPTFVAVSRRVRVKTPLVGGLATITRTRIAFYDSGADIPLPEEIPALVDEFVHFFREEVAARLWVDSPAA
jgi:hypothetical protein